MNDSFFSSMMTTNELDKTNKKNIYLYLTHQVFGNIKASISNTSPKKQDNPNIKYVRMRIKQATDNIMITNLYIL